MNNTGMKPAYQIKSPFCGRDKDGCFKCVCGKCTPIVSKEGDNSRNNSSDGRNN